MFNKIKKIIEKIYSVEDKKIIKIENNNLMLAAKSGDCYLMQKALDNGADINYSNGNMSVLFNAIKSDKTQAIKFILDNKADLTFQGDSSITAIHFAMSCDAKDETLNLLLDYNFNHNIQNIDGNTNVHIVCARKDLLKKIVEKGGDLNVKNNEGKTPFHYRLVS